MIDCKTCRTKKIFGLLAVISILVFALALVGCTGNQQNSSASSSAASSSSSAEASSASDNSTEVEGFGNTLVVYFSATGNTEKVAKEIASVTDATTFELKPVKAYTSEDLEYNDGNSRVSREHDDKSLRDIKLESTTVPNWDSFNTVFIGYPIWWGEAAWPVDGFVSSNDFTGKIVIPFCTSGSSDIGNSGKALSELAGTGDWQKGERFSGSATAASIKEWVESLA